MWTDWKRLRQALLTLIPYALLSLWLLQVALLNWLAPDQYNWLFSIERWGLRILFFTIAVMLWGNATMPLRPLWHYTWLGFALYEVAGTMLYLAMFSTNGLNLPAIVGALLFLCLLVLAFLPWIIVSTWLAWHDRQLALFTIFPHAALTIPLFFLAIETGLPPEISSSLWGVALVILLAGGVPVWYSFLTKRGRWQLLYAAMAVGQIATAWVVTNFEMGVALMLSVILLCLGSLILTAPLILVSLLPFLRRLLARFVSLDPSAWLERIKQYLIAPIHLAPIHPVHLNQPVDAVPDFVKGVSFMNEVNETVTPPPSVSPVRLSISPRPPGPGFERLYKWAVIVLALFAIGALLTGLGRSTIYKIHEYERGLHLRGGRFLGVQDPGWHFQIPLVDTVIIVKVNERLGYVERIPAMTSDNVTMIVSLQYTYRVLDPQQFALQVDDPERIVFEFVQGKLRDVVNGEAMADVMNNRVSMNEQVMAALKEKETQYGVKFVTVQLQSASPPDEVLAAIKDRMVAGQRQEQAQAEAAQKKTQADAEFYAAQKQAEAQAYQITKIAEADAQRIRLTTEAQQLAVRSIITELEGKGSLGEKYIEYLTAQQLKENSKWVISGGSAPIVDLRGDTVK